MKLKLLLVVALCFGAFIAFQLVKFGRVSLLPRPVLVTAEEALAEIDSDPNGYYPEGNTVVDLPPQELEKVVAELRSRFPFESLVDRMPPARNTSSGSQEPKLSEESVALLEDIDRENDSRIQTTRARSLEQLHGDEVVDFINREGFGFQRRPPNLFPSPKNLYADSRSFELKPIETTSEMVEGKLVELTQGYKVSDNGLPGRGMLAKFNRESQWNFAKPDSQGWVKDVSAVAGFEPHRLEVFSRWDGSVLDYNKPDSHDWKINRIELVSLLLQDEPQVYVSDQLPTMENLDERETRRLSNFEEEGLKKLRDGETLHISANLNRIEMLGAIRMAESCTQCHQGAKGELLGAFSYEILREPQLKTPVENAGENAGENVD